MRKFFQKCQWHGWCYILRFKNGNIPTIADEFERIKKLEGNRQERKCNEGTYWYDYASGIDYNGHKINVVKYAEKRSVEMKRGSDKGNRKEVQSGFVFLTDLPVSKNNVSNLVERGRMRWKIENEGFNTQKRHGY